MRPTLHITALELRRRLRDRSALVIAFVAPVALAVIISLAFGGDGEGFHATVAVATADDDQLASLYRDEVLGRLAAEGVVTITEVADGNAVADVLADGTADVGVILPAGMTQAVAGTGDPVTVEVARRTDRRLAGQLLEAVSEEFVAELERRRSGAAPQPAFRVIDDDAGNHLAASSYFGPSMALLFVMLTLVAAPKSLLADRDGGQLARVRAAPVPAWSAPVGKAAAAAVLALCSIGTVWAVSVLVFDATWGSPLAVIVLSATTVAAFGALAALIAAVARTSQQTEGLGMIVAFTLGLVGGHFFELHHMPPALQTVSLATPNGWALRAFTDLAADGAGLADILPALAMIAGLGTLIATGAVLLLRLRVS